MNATAMADKLKKIRSKLEKKHLEGEGGFKICRSWTRSVDKLIGELFSSLTDLKNIEAQPFALAALGGYGRGELNPYSDIDLLFLFEKDKFVAEKSPLTRVIPALWDTGLKVGHSTRSIADCIKIAQDDLISKTSMIEARFLLGNKAVFDLFTHRFKTRSVSKGQKSFLRDKRIETEMRHEKYHNTLFLTEPDVKESPGGLRDYHVALWAAAVRYGVMSLEKLEKRGLLEWEGASEVSDAVDIVLRIRNDLHFLSKGPSDHLNYGVQPKTAERLGFKGSGDKPVIDMMREYYRAANTIYRLGKSILDQANRYSGKAPKIISWLRHRKLAPSVFAGPSEIYVKGMAASEIAQSPEKLFDLLRLASENELTPSPGLRRIIEQTGRHWQIDKPDEKTLAEGLRSLLKTPRPMRILRLMRDLGIMSVIIPEFLRIRFLTPFDLYHKYTVDDHSLQAIQEFDNLKLNESKECDLLRILYEEEDCKELLRLAILLHDIGKGDHSAIAKQEVVPAILRRLDYGEEDARVITKLIDLHLLMSQVSQRRDIHDEKTITSFCDEIGNAKILKRLYLLTYADIRAVGPGIWNSWKGMLLKELFLQADRRLEGKDRLMDIMPALITPHEKLSSAAKIFINGMPNRYFLKRALKEVEEDARLFSGYVDGDGAAKINHRVLAQSEPGEVTVISKNKMGLLYKVVGTLSSKNVDILDSQIFTHKDGIAVDHFRVNGPNGKPITDETFWLRIENEIKRVISGERRVEDLLRERKKIASSPVNLPHLETRVRILNDVSFDNTVIEISARDRLALLYDMTRTLSKLNAEIVSARISTEGHKAVNTFYVRNADGRKITSPEQIDEIKMELLAALPY